MTRTLTGKVALVTGGSRGIVARFSRATSTPTDDGDGGSLRHHTRLY